jgi:hypothetical protein
MHEIQFKGSQAMTLDVLVLEHKLSERQKRVLESLMASEKDFNIQKYEALCPEVNRRSLQRDLADVIEKGIITQDGIKKAARYRLNRFR